MSSIFSLPNLYVLLWGLYFTQGTILPQGSIWSRLTLLLFLSISIILSVLSIFKFNSNSYLKALGVLLCMFTIYGIFDLVNGYGGIDDMKAIYLSLLPTYSFYYFTKKCKIDVIWIRKFFFFGAITIAIQYYMQLRLNEELYIEVENHVVNVAYEILALIPLIFFWKSKPLIQYILLGLIMALILSTVKRGAILIGLVCTVYLLYILARSASRKVKLYIFLLTILFALISIKYVIYFLQNNQLAQMRIQATLEGNSSSRDILFNSAWNLFINSDFFSLLFGNGLASTYNLLGNYAHNDWLEILINQGLLGLLIYLYYWFCFVKMYISDINKDTRCILGTLIIIYFLSTLFSMSYSAMTLPASVALGYSLANGIYKYK